MEVAMLKEEEAQLWQKTCLLKHESARLQSLLDFAWMWHLYILRRKLIQQQPENRPNRSLIHGEWSKPALATSEACERDDLKADYMDGSFENYSCRAKRRSR